MPAGVRVPREYGFNCLQAFTFLGIRVKLPGFQQALLATGAGASISNSIEDTGFMVTIRMSRGGAKKRPFYHIVVSDSRNSRDGRCIERIGFFNPIAKGGEERLRIDSARAEHWTAQGAQVSDRVSRLLKEQQAQ